MQESTERKFAVITGASSGIGYDLAKQFAGHKFDLLVMAEDPGRIAEAAKAWGQNDDITLETVAHA